VEAFAGCSVLVTGGAGFVGSNLVRTLLGAEAAKIHIVDNLLSAERNNIPDNPRVAFTEASITDDNLLAALKDEYDYAFHLCTYHGNQSSICDPLADHANNTLTTLKLYQRMKEFKRLKKLVYSSAGCSVAEKTFGAATATEETNIVSLNQDSPYSMSKIFGEFYSCYYFKQHGLPAVRARFQNVYGPGEILGAGKWRGTPATVWRNVTPTFIYKALNKQPLPIENEGIATRDFIYVDDVVAGLVACAAKGKAGDVYNIASGEETSIAELAAKINRLAGNPVPVHLLPKRPWDNSGKRFGSTNKSFRELGFKARTGIDEGLSRTIQWTKDNMALINETIAKHRRHIDSI
jgi:nucleoside-diphosphate-sugar epimerase